MRTRGVLPKPSGRQKIIRLSSTMLIVSVAITTRKILGPIVVLKGIYLANQRKEKS
jgi:hypothetical protein